MNKKQLVDFLKDNAEVSFEALYEDTQVRGNAQAIDPVSDKEVEDNILQRINNGDLSAWFCAKVTASYKGFKWSDFLGCCSYNSIEEFTKEERGYYTDMVHCAITGLADYIIESNKTLEELDASI